jgi:hypothetical protein
MPIPTYTPGYPPDGSSLGQTKSTIRNNLDGTFETLAVDHIDNNGSPGSKPAGYHKVIHQVTQTNVSTITGYNQVFSGVPGTLVVDGVTTQAIPSNSDTELYSLTSGGILTQLTGRSAGLNGFVWIGGMLLQWGSIAATSGNPSVNLASSPNVPFPNNIFNIQVTRQHSATSPGSTFGFWVNNTSGTITTSGFQIISNDTHTWSYNWIAIGN